ncbi:MAG: hypothetical protein ACT4ON_05695 [Bacteroidota bacterium]
MATVLGAIAFFAATGAFLTIVALFFCSLTGRTAFFAGVLIFFEDLGAFATTFLTTFFTGFAAFFILGFFFTMFLDPDGRADFVFIFLAALTGFAFDKGLPFEALAAFLTFFILLGFLPITVEYSTKLSQYIKKY